ncbi:MAG: site-specific DNA-methyltransferase, partial [Verrucomicrobia bacterium]|nr:site-specific DNA-methyltransferase [Verrucomicrobiota bacterium]
LDPFGGSGTTGVAAKEEGRNAILIELNPEYSRFSKERIRHANQQNFQL